MRPLDQAVRNAFLEAARGRGVAAREVWDYVKWLRYFLDFCDKYRHEALDRDSLQAFLLKLASKNQSAELQAQAARSVRLYLELAAPGPAAPPAPAPTAAPRRAPPASAPVAPPATAIPRRVLPAQIRPAGAAPTVGDVAHPARMGDRTAPWPHASPWDAVIARIKKEVKIRQYSPKTFDAYAGWTRQFAGFAGKPPDGIVMQDVKAFLTHLAMDGRVVASTQNQAFNALLFLFRHSDVQTTMIYTHTVPSRTQKERASPLDLDHRDHRTIGDGPEDNSSVEFLPIT